MIESLTVERMLKDAEQDSDAVTELASVLAEEWCNQWDGVPSDPVEWMQQVWYFRPEARHLLKAIKKRPKETRTPLGNAIRD